VIGLDTNVLVRYIVRDEPRQTAAATKQIESFCTADSPGIISLIVLCELVCVLDRGYGYSRSQIAGVLRRLLSADELQAERSELAWRGLGYYEKGRADYADYLIGLSCREEEASATVTFDRRTSDCDLFRVLQT